MLELDKKTHEAIKTLCAEGDALAGRGGYREAIDLYNNAYKLIPDPKNEFEATTWVLTALGDSCFLGGWYTSGQEAFEYAVSCPGGLGNPFIHLRLGQCEYERGNNERAADELARAYMGAGSEIFETEDQKYFQFLKSQIESPVGGAW